MQLRKALIVGAAVLAAGLLSLTPTSQADPPTGGPIVFVEVNGVQSLPNNPVPVNGTFAGGTYTHDLTGFTTSCTHSTLAGTVNRSARPLPAGAHDFGFSSLHMPCAYAIYTDTWTITPGCVLRANFYDDNVHDGTVDTGPYNLGASFHAVRGRLSIPHACITVTRSGGCTYRIDGDVGASFDEAITTVGGVRYQKLVLDGPGLTMRQQTPSCLGVAGGSITLNNMTFNLQVTGGSTTGIDFRQTLPALPTGGAVAAVEVNGDRTVGTVAMDGVFRAGTKTYSIFGFDAGCAVGSMAGTVTRGPRPLTTGVRDMTLSTLDLTCATPLGVNGKISITPGCVMTLDFPDTPNVQDTGPNVHDGTVDTGPGPAFSRVEGRASVASQCLTMLLSGSSCAAKLSGDIDAYFDEAVKTVGGVAYQELILNGDGLTYSQQTPACLSLMTGGLRLNNIKYDVRVASGTTTGIDFRQTA
ncbi:MAG TPA: hypothetical protein VMF51_18820 [Nocardioides sp.]|uniref:hypothetical protein n=1 Tax=Nocardioides sp. TaxID=35761 RepID=UPI002C0EC610|nr:hypothetical protein [Nocardioides sp.]HTW17190.1 hypothetical protein [Nocardioides sp.]